MINALFAIQLNSVEQFLDNWRIDEEGNRLATDFAPYQTAPDTPLIDVYSLADCTVPEVSQYLWKDDLSSPSPVQKKQLVTLQVANKTELDWTDPDDPDPKEIVTVIHYLREVFPGSIQVMDVFKVEGVRHGQTLIPATFDDQGNEITPEEIIGIPTYPPMPKTNALEFMPDDVVYDNDGNEVSRTPATDYKQVNKVLGFADRRYE